MNPFEMALGIVIVVMIARVLMVRYRHARPADGGIGPARDDGEADRLRGEVRQLKDRIAVLERIVTDGDRNRSIALEREIEALRDEKEPR